MLSIFTSLDHAGKAVETRSGDMKITRLGVVAIRAAALVWPVTRSPSMFPTGLAGVALLLLRMSVAASLEAGTSFIDPVWFHVASLPVIVGLVIGILTRWLAALAVVAACFVCVTVDDPVRTASALLGACAISLGMLGPGGYSIDARLFGRRLVRLDR